MARTCRVPHRVRRLAATAVVAFALLAAAPGAVAIDADSGTLSLAVLLAMLVALAWYAVCRRRPRMAWAQGRKKGLARVVAIGQPIHRRVRIAVYAVLLVVGSHATLQAWQVGHVEGERVEHARLADLVASQRWVSQRIGRLAALVLADGATWPAAGAQLAALLRRAEDDAGRMEAMLARLGVLRQSDAQQLNIAWAAWIAENTKLLSAASTLSGYAALHDPRASAPLAIAVQRQADDSLDAAERLVEALAHLVRTRQFTALSRAHTWSLLTFVVLLALALFVAEPVVRSVRRQQRQLVGRMRQLRLLALVAERTTNVVIVTDERQKIVRVNAAFRYVTGYESYEAIGRTPRQLMKSDRQTHDFYERLDEALSAGRDWQGELWNRRKNGELYLARLCITAVKDTHDRIENYIAVLTDITERRKADETIRNLAYYDPLTELPNRRLLRDRLHQAMDSSAKSGRFAAILFIDLDHFKELNDIRGHDVGDLLLIEVAKRLSGEVRSTDTVARQGGDEFVVIIDGLGDDPASAAQEAEAIAECIRTALSRPYLLSGHEYHGTSSIGISVFTGHEYRVGELLRRADIALYQAKRAGRNVLRFFDPETHAAMKERIALEIDLRRALPEHQLRVHLQPQVDQEGCLVGAEALVRWLHPRRGLVSPAQFIGLAEESDLILDIGTWVLERACAQLVAWSGTPGCCQLTLAVNVSARQFRQRNFVTQVRDIVRQSGIDPCRLKLELTESLVIADIDETVRRMNELRALGIGFSMDDFGTGQSSLAYLTRLPLSQLKIDQSFVHKMMSSRCDAVVVQAIVGLAKSLSIEAIAEGVETTEQRVFLEAIGCNLYQGYLYGAPLPAEEFSASWGGTFRVASPPEEQRELTRT